MLIEVSDSESAHVAARRLEDVGFVAYVPTVRIGKKRHLVQVATNRHEHVAGLASQRAIEVVREVDPAARPLLAPR